MGACVSKFNNLSGAQTNMPEKTLEETVKDELPPADEQSDRRSLGYLFKENKGEAPAESSSKEAAGSVEEKEKSPISNEKSSEDVKLSSQNVDGEGPLKKGEEEISDVQILETVEKSEESEGDVNDTLRSEDQEPGLPLEKDVKLSYAEITKKKVDETGAEAQVIENEDEKPALDVESQPCERRPETWKTNKIENKPCDTANVVASHTKSECSTLETKPQEEMMLAPSLDSEKKNDIEETPEMKMIYEQQFPELDAQAYKLDK